MTEIVRLTSHGGICRACSRRFKDRIWGEDEYVKQNWQRGLALEISEEKLREEHKTIHKHLYPAMKQCPMNCKYIVEFA